MIKLKSWMQKPWTDFTCFVILCSMVLVCLSTTYAHAKDYTFSWSANPEPVEGYRLYYKKGGEAGPPYDGTNSLNGLSPIDIGKLTTFTISGLEDDTTYHFALTAYDGNDESGFSQNITVFPADNSPPSDPSPTLEAVITTDRQEGEVPLTINFDAGSSSGSIDSYTWTFGDGDTASGATTSHIYQTAGTYTATLTVSDTSGSSQETNVVITATESSPIQPTAVITSSSAAGDAPFTINFDGSGSTTSQPPFTSYSWDFDDGATAEGVSVAHTYTSAGTYNPSLTVYDSAGLSDKVTTPVIINPTPEPTTNQPPTSSFIATSGYGAPLIVSFDGSGSNDADGTIKSYAWNFGDETSATGSSTQHTYTDTGDYTVTLTVTDNMNATAVSSQVVSVITEDEIEFNFELQEIEVDHNWTRFDFAQPFVDPVVVAGPPSFNESQPATVRVRNINASGCDIRIQEWDYLDGNHVPEKLTLLVMERGAYTTSDGSKIEAGTFTGTTSFQKIDLLQTYTNTPVILSQVITENETDAVTGRLHNTNTSSFWYKMQEQELTPTHHVNETIGYIAWESGSGEIMGLPYEVGFTPKEVTHDWYNITFQSDFPDMPLLIAGMQTYNGGDIAAIRSNNPSVNSIQVKIEEESSKNEETNHVPEVVGYLIIGTGASAEVNFELQEIEIDHNWTRFDFTQPFVEPVVVAGPPSFNGSQPATVRVRNIDATGCDIRIQEWDYLDGKHVPEKLTLLVMERGAYTTSDGSKIEAGTFTGTTSFQEIALLQTYTHTPVILSQIITENETDAVTCRLHNTNTSSFWYKMQEQELTPTHHVNETIGYIAWESGSGEIMGLPYEVGFTPKKVTNEWYNITFQSGFPDMPLLIAAMQTSNGGDVAAIRSNNPSVNSIQVKIEEEASKDEETNHTTEVVGYLIIGTEVSTQEKK
jgi:PKD repeat protein